MSIDGGLRKLFRDNLTQFHWTSVETGGTASGVADSNWLSPDGVEGWIEYKKTGAWAVRLKPAQVGWLFHRARYGGRAVIMVRRRCGPSPRRGAAVDELWAVQAANVRALARDGLRAKLAGAVCLGEGGPRNWRWDEVVAYVLAAPARVQEKGDGH